MPQATTALPQSQAEVPVFENVGPDLVSKFECYQGCRPRRYRRGRGHIVLILSMAVTLFSTRGPRRVFEVRSVVRGTALRTVVIRATSVFTFA